MKSLRLFALLPLLLGAYKPHLIAQQGFTSNTTATTIRATNQVHPALGAPVTRTAGITVNAGTSIDITSFADYSGTVAGTILATTSAAHNLSTDEWVVVLGANVEAGDAQPYYGVYQITVVSTTTFYFTQTFAGTTTAWVYRGDQFVAPYSGWYQFSAYGTFESAVANQTYRISAYANGTPKDPFALETTAKSIGALSSASSMADVELTAGDVLWYGVANLTSAANFTLQSASIHLETD